MLSKTEIDNWIDKLDESSEDDAKYDPIEQMIDGSYFDTSEGIKLVFQLKYILIFEFLDEKDHKSLARGKFLNNKVNSFYAELHLHFLSKRIWFGTSDTQQKRLIPLETKKKQKMGPKSLDNPKNQIFAKTDKIFNLKMNKKNINVKRDSKKFKLNSKPKIVTQNMPKMMKREKGMNKTMENFESNKNDNQLPSLSSTLSQLNFPGQKTQKNIYLKLDFRSASNLANFEESKLFLIYRGYKSYNEQMEKFN